MARSKLAASVLLAALWSCSEGDPSGPDAGAADAAPTDTAGLDSGPRDGGAVDAGEDGGSSDAGACMPEGAPLDGTTDLAVTLDTDGPDTACALATAPSALLHFVAPEAGWYRVETEGPTDTLLELRGACTDERLQCNDQYGGDDARIWFEAQAGQAFEIVLAAVSEGGPTTIRVRAGAPVRPAITSLRYFRGARGFAFDIDTGDTDVAGARLSPGPAGLLPLTARDGGFALTGTSTLPARVAVTLVSHGGFEGAPVEATAEAPAEVSGACDPTGARTVCQAGLRCAFWSETPSCVEAGAPELDLAELYVNPERQTVGVYVQGRDPQANIALVQVDLLDAEGVPLGASALARLERVEGTAEGQAGFVSGVLAPGLQPAQADVRLVDTADERSPPVRALRRGPIAALEGDGCDLHGALTRCPAGTVCSLETGRPGDVSRCLPPVTGCPEGVTRHLVTLTSTGGFDLDEDDFAPPGAATAAAACGGGQAGLRVVELTAVIDGLVAFELVRADDFVDPLVWVRSHCGEPAPGLELGCFDDPPTGTSLRPRGEVRVDAGATIYLGIDRHPGPVDIEDLLLRIDFRSPDE